MNIGCIAGNVTAHDIAVATIEPAAVVFCIIAADGAVDDRSVAAV